MLAGSDLANGWAGFIDGAIESGLRAGRWAAAIAERAVESLSAAVSPRAWAP